MQPANSASAAEWYVLGNAYSQLKMLSAAEDAYKRCIQLNGRFGQAWNNLGAALELTGNTQSALEDYKQAAALGDAYGEQNYANLGKYDRASPATNVSIGPSWCHGKHHG
jgi:tetratricopeptide (TPR) repeat protein